MDPRNVAVAGPRLADDARLEAVRALRNCAAYLDERAEELVGSVDTTPESGGLSFTIELRSDGLPTITARHVHMVL